PRGAAARDLPEARLAERRSESGPGEGGGDASLSRLDGVSLHHPSAPAASQFDRGLKQRDGDTTAPLIPVDEQAAHRPDGLVVPRAENFGVGQDRIRRARSDGAPGDRPAPPVGQDSGCISRQDDLAERPAVARSFAPYIFGAPPSPVHAPAAGAAA